SLQTKHLQLSLSGAETAVRPGQRISLAVQIELPRRMHVYAPGVTGYLPVSLTFKPSTAFRAEAVSYPPAKSLKLEAIHETALVYDRKFRLVDTITLANAPEIDSQLDNDRNLIIQAELRYQACDDRECFLPETVPLQWRIHVLPFDRTRAPETLRRRP